MPGKLKATITVAVTNPDGSEFHTTTLSYPNLEYADLVALEGALVPAAAQALVGLGQKNIAAKAGG